MSANIMNKASIIKYLMINQKHGLVRKENFVSDHTMKNI